MVADTVMEFFRAARKHAVAIMPVINLNPLSWDWFGDAKASRRPPEIMVSWLFLTLIFGVYEDGVDNQ